MINLHHDYLIGLPSQYDDGLKIKGPNDTTIELVKWGFDGSKYENRQTTGVILESPKALYGPKVATKPKATVLRPSGRLLRFCKDGSQIFEGAIKEGILAKGTLVVVKPGWQLLAKRTDSKTEAMLDEMYPDWIYTIVQPQGIMAYCNESTDWQWVGYAGMVMLENVEETTTLKSKILALHPAKQERMNIRRVVGPGYCMESGEYFKRDELLYCTPKQGAPIKINTGFSKTKVKNQEVTFTPGSTILASVEKRKDMKYEVKPKAGRVLVRPDQPDKRWASQTLDLIKPDSAIQLPNRGTVVAVGTSMEGGEMETKVGQLVLYPQNTGSTIEVNDEKFLILYETDLWADLNAG